MAVTPTTPTNTTAAATNAKKTAKTKEDAPSNGLTADFGTFLKLLTTQMKNQGPLQPMDSTEFVSQLASFSSVEQQVTSNTKLDSILGALSTGSTASLAEWIGKDVRAATSASYSGSPVEIGVKPASGADSAKLVVKNDFGAEVARIAVDPTADPVTWDGTDGSGKALANGDYSFAVESFTGETALGSAPGQVFSKVKEVRLGDDGATELVLANGDQVDAATISAVR